MAGEPFGDLPRQRLVSVGAVALTDAELLTLLLKGGRGNLESVEVVRHLLHEMGGLGSLPGSSVAALKKHGAREGHAVSLVAVVELARRLAWAEIPECDPMSHPREVARCPSLTYAGQDQEILGVLFLNCRHRLLGCREIYRGTMTRVAVEPRAILKEALLADAASFVLFPRTQAAIPS